MSTLETHADSPLAHRTVSQAMHRGVINFEGGTPITTVAAGMASHAIHAAVILSPEGERAVAVSGLDLTRAALSGEGGRPVADIAREPMPAIGPWAPLLTAAGLMATRDVAHVLVTVEADTTWPAGIVSSFDVVSVLAGRDPAVTRVIRPGPARPLVSATELTATTVGAVMHPGVVHCPPATPLVEVAAAMADLRLHCVAVAGVGRRGGGDEHFMWGLVTDMDIVHAAYRGEDAVAAADVASSSPLAVSETTSLHRAATLLVEHGATHLVAVGRSGMPSGVVSTLDVLRVVAAG